MLGEALELKIEIDTCIECSLRHETNNLTRRNIHTVAVSFTAHHFECPEDWSRLVVDKVHRNLHLAAILELKPERLDVLQPTVATPNGPGYLLCYADIGSRQIDVVCDQ